MRLCKLTLNWGEDGSPTWINPMNVIAIWALGDGTSITTVGNGREQPYTIFVTEPPETVAALLNDALK